jgi:hypothetical protein
MPFHVNRFDPTWIKKKGTYSFGKQYIEMAYAFI